MSYTKMSIKDELSKGAEEAGRGGSEFFKFEKGENRLRVLAEGKVISTHFFGTGLPAHVCYGIKKGCPFHSGDEKRDGRLGTKFTTYILDRKDGKIKIADFPYSVTKSLSDLEEDSDFSFKGYPMPYDIKVKFDPDASPADMYKTYASPKREPVSEDTLGELAGKMGQMTPDELVEKKKVKSLENHKKMGIWISPEALAEAEQERKRKFKEAVQEHNAKAKDDKIEYPVDEVNPDDIPF